MSHGSRGSWLDGSWATCVIWVSPLMDHTVTMLSSIVSSAQKAEAQDPTEGSTGDGVLGKKAAPP